MKDRLSVRFQSLPCEAWKAVHAENERTLGDCLVSLLMLFHANLLLLRVGKKRDSGSQDLNWSRTKVSRPHKARVTAETQEQLLPAKKSCKERETAVGTLRQMSIERPRIQFAPKPKFRLGEKKKQQRHWTNCITTVIQPQGENGKSLTGMLEHLYTGLV